LKGDSNVNNFQEVLDQLLENEELLQSIKDFSCMGLLFFMIDYINEILNLLYIISQINQNKSFLGILD